MIKNNLINSINDQSSEKDDDTDGLSFEELDHVAGVRYLRIDENEE